MSDDKKRPRSIFESLSPEELSSVKVPSEEEFKEVLRKAQEQYRKSIADHHPRYPRY
jgi:hypothetical protein